LETNYLKGISLEADPPPDLGSCDVATITDGVIEGWYEDNLSSGWTVPAAVGHFKVSLQGDLKRTVDCSRLSIRVGGLEPAHFADRAALYLGTEPGDLKLVLDEALTSSDGMNWFEFTERPARFIRIELVTDSPNGSTGRLDLGEIQLIGVVRSLGE